MASGEAACSDGATPSVSLYSGSTSTLSDLPIRAGSVRLRFSVRRFCCMRRPCPKCTFSEPLAPPIGRRYCRRVGRCEAVVRGSNCVGRQPRARMLARTTGISRQTIRKVLRGQRHDTFRTRWKPLDARSVNLEAEGSGGCRIGVELWRWLKASGFGGSLRVKRQMYGRAMIDLLKVRGMAPAGPKLHEI